eukprot:2663356-Rhodomonas_salina.1
MRQEQETIREIKREMENIEEDADTRLGDNPQLLSSPVPVSFAAGVAVKEAVSGSHWCAYWVAVML